MYKQSEYIRKYNLPEKRGYRTEINLRIKDYLKDINTILSEGYVISIDYGYSSREYYAEERNKGTLLCYYKHKIRENPYMNIGHQDITAHINFSALKDWGGT
jgi:SAM-dependent MidA family methyltransferase